MAWTTPRTWATAEVVTATNMNTHLRDNVRYLKGLDGAVVIEDRVTIPMVSGTNGRGLRFGDGSAQYATLQVLDLSGTYLFFAANRVYDGTAWQQLNARAAGAMLISGNTDLVYSTFPAASSTPTERWRLNANGDMGLGTATPQGRLHGQGAIGGFMYYEYDGVDGTARTVIPNATGDVTLSLQGMWVVRTSGGSNGGGVITTAGAGLLPGANLSLWTSGSDVLQLQIAANGAVTVQRTGGTLTYKVALWLLWM